MAGTLSDLAARINALIAYWRARDTEYAAWVAGQANGGPEGDGRYPLTSYTGQTSLVRSPASLAAQVEGTVSSAAAHATSAATSAAQSSASASAAAARAADIATRCDAAVSARDTAMMYRDQAASSATNAAASAANLPSSSAWNGPHLVLGAYHLWVDGANALRFKLGSPSSDTDGAAVVTA